VKAREVHDFQLWAADGYAMVTPPVPMADPGHHVGGPAGDHHCSRPRHGQTLAALKLFRDEWDAADLAHLYIREDDGTVLHFPLIKQGRTTITSGVFRFSRGLGAPRRRGGPPDRMPIIRFRNRGGRGEFERHLDTLDRINDQIMSKVVIAKVQAFRQMAIENLPDNVEQIDPGPVTWRPWRSTTPTRSRRPPVRLWRLPEGAKIWESTPTDLGPLRLSIKDDLENLAAVTQTALPGDHPRRCIRVRRRVLR
jgi:hypothetical protein